jgi:hypothetical protein
MVITINEGLAWLKTLKQRHEELLGFSETINESCKVPRRLRHPTADLWLPLQMVHVPAVDSRRLDPRALIR